MRSCLTLLALLLLAGPSRAADGWPVALGPSREPSPYKHDPKSVAALPKDFLDDASAVVLYAGSSHVVEADGTVETVVHEVARLNGRKGVAQLGEFKGIIFTPAYQKVTLNEARIFKADGRVVSVEARHSHLRDVGTDYAVYDPEKQLIISFPGLEVGDTIEVKWTTRGKNPEHGGRFFGRYAFGDPKYPVAIDEFHVVVPAAVKLKHATVNGKMAPKVVTKDARTHYAWRAEKVRELPKEDNLPSREELRETVAVSTFADWKEVGEWKAKLRKDCWDCSERMRGVVKAVTAGLKTPTEKARALTYWVKRNIRYVSVGDKHDYTPHKPETVVANRWGDCKDTAQLLAAMLKEAGIASELVTLSPLDDGQVHPDVPSPWGTHAILLVPIAGKKHWIDLTVTLSAWDGLPRDDHDRMCYITDEKGNIRLDRTPPVTSDSSKSETVTEMTVLGDGTSRCRRVTVSYGLTALAQRDMYLEVPAGERRRQVTSELQDANSRSRLAKLDIDDKELRDFDKPVRVVTEFDILRHFTGESEREASLTDSKVWGRLLAYTIDHDRTQPMVFPGPFDSLHVYKIRLPVTYGLEGVPRPKSVKSRWGSFELTTSIKDDGDAVRFVEITFRTKLEKPRIEVADLEEFRKFQEEVNKEYRVYLTTRVVESAASIPPLEKAIAADPKDAKVAKVLAKIYLRNDRQADAKKLIDAALKHHPADADLQKLRVDAADTPADEEQAQRALVAKNPKDLDHARALGSILVGQGKQDEARKILEPLTKEGTTQQKALTHYQLARSYYRQDKLAESLAQLDAGEKVDAEAVNILRVHMLRGQVCEELKKIPDAIAAYKKARGIEKRNQEVNLSLVRLSLIAKDEAAATRFLRGYVLDNDRDAAALRLAVETYLAMKRPDEALDVANRAKEITFHERTFRLLGLAHLMKREYEKAVAALEKAEPDAVVYAAMLESALASAKLGSVDRWVEKAERVEPMTEPLRVTIGRAKAVLVRRAALAKSVSVPAAKQAEAERALDAVACAEGALAAGRDATEVRDLLAKATVVGLPLPQTAAIRSRVILRQGKLAAALAEANAVLSAKVEDASAYYVRGVVRLEREQAGAAEDLARAAALSSRKDADILGALARAEAKAGRSAAATAAAREALALRPGDVELTDLLRSLERGTR